MHKFSALVLLAAVFAGSDTTEEMREVERPNIIMLMTDDQGIGDLGVTGNLVPSVIETPHLDRFASHGVHMTTSYVGPVVLPRERV